MNSVNSRKLFHRAISQSGNMMNIWSEPFRKGLAKDKAVKLADLMNCPNDSSEEIIKCLRTVPADKIANALRNFIVTYLLIRITTRLMA